MKAPVIFLIVILVLGGSVSHGFPEYSVKENKKCVYCHFNNQGGPTNTRGRYYAQHMSFDGYANRLKNNKKKKKKNKRASAKTGATSGDSTDNTSSNSGHGPGVITSPVPVSLPTTTGPETR